MECVYTLYHVHEWEGCGHDEVKLIGINTSEQLAREALARVKDQLGFCDHPEGFEINEARLNWDSWVEGYVTIHRPEPPFP